MPGASRLLGEAEALERSGATAEALARYLGAIQAAEAEDDRVVLVRALRRLAVLRHHRGETDQADQLFRRSYTLARRSGDDIAAAEALNVKAGFDFEAGQIDRARRTYLRALKLGGRHEPLRARIEQNLGILANIQGDLSGAARHYHSSLEAYQRVDDARGCGIAFHNLGMLSADCAHWDEADWYYRRSREIAVQAGDQHLAALCSLNASEVHLARQQYDRAMEGAETALAAFEKLGSKLDKSDAYRVIGMVYREIGRLPLAESRLTAAQELAAQSGSMLSQAEANRELALVYQAMGRNQDALSRLTTAYRLFSGLDARLDLVDISRKRDKLEQTYLAVVRDWGQSIESADSYTFGHCERVAGYAMALAGALGLDEAARTTIQLGAYLHDLGKIRVPHEILNKTGRLTDEEFQVIQQHPAWGVELLEGVEFPWELKPLIRSHHEKYDGTGYPDRLVGDAIPLGAQILCVADVYDALTTTRSYRPAMPHQRAREVMRESRSWWRSDVLAAFESAVHEPMRIAA
jgi:putative nucleotidyltransferase with HDIG domain